VQELGVTLLSLLTVQDLQAIQTSS
jgi:hypothetical protein